MVKPVPDLAAPSPYGWDIAFTKIHRALQPHVDAGMLDLMRRFQAVGLLGELQMRQTPRGQSTFLSLSDRRGLLFIVDVTLVNGLVVARQQGARLDIRLLDGNGDVLAAGLVGDETDKAIYHLGAEQVIDAADLARAIPSVYLLAICCIDVHPVANQQDRP